METIQAGKPKRIYYLDLLRVFACFFVIVLHASAQNWASVDVAGTSWLAFNFYDSLARFCVPLLVMVSGALFLNPERRVTTGSLYRKYIPRLLTAYLFWSLFYAGWKLWSGSSAAVQDAAVSGTAGGVDGMGGLEQLFSAALDGHYHLWYLPMIIGIYILVPLYRCITREGQDSRKLLFYLICVFAVFGVILRQMLLLCTGEYTLKLLEKFSVDSFLNYSGYFFLGYYLYRYPLEKRVRLVMYGLGVGGVVLCTAGTRFLSLAAQAPTDLLYSNLSITTFFTSIAVFVFFQSLAENRRQGGGLKLLDSLSVCSFGIYLIHVFYLELLSRYGFDTLFLAGVVRFQPVFSVPVLSVSVFLISYVTILAIRRIPFVHRYIT